MDYVVVPFAGDGIDAMAELIGPRAMPMVVVSDNNAWSRMNITNAPIRRGLIQMYGRMRLVTVADLSQIEQSKYGISDTVKTLMEDPNSLIALHDSQRWEREATAEVVEQIRHSDQPVLFFTEDSTNIGEITRVTPEIGLIGNIRRTTVVGIPQQALHRGQDLVYKVENPQRLRVRDIVANYNQRAPAGRFDLMRPVGRPGRLRQFAADLGPGVLARGDETPQSPTPPEERTVNAWIALPGEDDSVDSATALTASTRYDVLVNIGHARSGSLLPRTDARFPSEHLPDGDLPLRAVLDMGENPQTYSFTLPTTGESFTCDCPNSGDVSQHATGCRRRPFVRFEITTPGSPQVWTGHLIIYYHAVPVHVQELILPVDITTQAGLESHLVYCLTRSFASLGVLSERTASLLVTNGGSRVTVNGLSFLDNPFSITTNAADDVVRGARIRLYNQSFQDTDHGPQSRLDDNFGKKYEHYISDLAGLASIGWQIYSGIFDPRDRTFDTLPKLIRQEATARGRPPVLTIAGRHEEESVPWSLMYDLPIAVDRNYQVCQSTTEFGPPRRPTDTIPLTCQYEQKHSDNVLCPFGFWGLSCMIEQPASTDGLTWTVLQNQARPNVVTMTADSSLDQDLTAKHRETLEGGLPPKTLNYQLVESADALGTALAHETMDVAYVYCHGGYFINEEGTRPQVALQFGDEKVRPFDIAGWRRGTTWGYRHWPERRPLVILNGCHTTTMTSATLANFVDAFTRFGNAAGAIGTEVTVDQPMANWVGEMLLHGLVQNRTVGEVIRDVRWRMIQRGNTQAFAYTLYSVAGLRLRPDHQ
jgi:hypothetical protein